MSEVFLEIVTAKFTAADFEKHQLSIPFSKGDDGFKIIFFIEADYYKCLKELEKECNNFLSEYWIDKSPELIDKNKFIIKVLTVMNNEYSKKFDCLY